MGWTSRQRRLCRSLNLYAAFIPARLRSLPRVVASAPSGSFQGHVPSRLYANLMRRFVRCRPPPWSSTVQDLTYLVLILVLAISVAGLIAGCDALGARE